MTIEEQSNSAIPAGESFLFKKLFTQLNEAWHLFINNFWRLIGLYIIGIVVPIVLICFSIIPAVGPIFFAKSFGEYSKYFITIGGGMTFVISLVAVILWLVGYLAIYVFISRESGAKIGETIKMSLKLVFPFIGGLILIRIMTSIGMLFLIIPGIVLVIILSIWPFIFVKENIGAIGSIKKCFFLMKGFFWIFCLRYLEAYLITTLGLVATGLIVFLFFKINFAVGVTVLAVCYFAFLIYGIFLKYFYYTLYKNIAESKNNNPEAKYKLNGKEKALLIILAFFVLVGAGFYQYFAGKIKEATRKETETHFTSSLPQNVKDSLPIAASNSETAKSRDDLKIKNLEKIRVALEEYSHDHNGEYPIGKGELGGDLYCLVDYATRPEISGFISRIKNIEYLKLCREADKIYLDRVISLSTKGNFIYESMCIDQCLSGEKNNFYAINFSLEADTNDLKAGQNCLMPSGFSSRSCLSAEIDSDEDGLSDMKEIYVYETDRLNADTDGDGYTDGDEVNGGYNPAGSGKL
ncbi:MAG TPA: hypothetical protein VJB41_02005 [Patescibacteria group bacterium]|nr:hypothetical protein [Patescibacteria group bacterium]